MSGGTDDLDSRLLIRLPVEKVLEEFLLEEFEAGTSFTHGCKVSRNFLSAVAGENLGQFPVTRFQCRKSRQRGATKALEGIVCHG